MKKCLFAIALLCAHTLQAQLNPAITNWLINTSGLTGSHYVQGNSTPIADNVAANVQAVQYSTNFVYVTTTGIPAYVTGPFLDGNPSLATNQNAIFKLSLNPTANAGALTSTTGGNIGIFINGVALFDYRDGVAWNAQTNALCGGPGNPPCPGGPNANMPWNRDAVLAEKAGFDCSKGHPAMGNYHHHQNPSAFKLDLQVISTICDVYDADGLYVIDSMQHAPLIGFAADGFPIYGAYGFQNTNGTGDITRIKSAYQLRNISVRTHWADGTDVADGPVVSSTYPLGYFREDYEYIAHPGQQEYLDASNGRFCVTPEYPNGTYCYFATVDENWNAAYPYVVGPKFHGVVTGAKVTSITEPVTTYTSNAGLQELSSTDWQVWPNPSHEIAMVQVNGLASQSRKVALYDQQGRLIAQKILAQGSTIVYFEIDTLYQGLYLIRVEGDAQSKTLVVH
jgi:hypothetical protein